MAIHSRILAWRIPWTEEPDGLQVIRLAPLSMGFSRQESCSGLLFPSRGDLSNPGIKPESPAWQVDSLPLSHQGSFKQSYRGAKAERKMPRGRSMEKWARRAARKERKMGIPLPSPASLSSKHIPRSKGAP